MTRPTGRTSSGRDRTGVSRRSLLQGALAAGGALAAAGLTGCGRESTLEPVASHGWRQYAGTSINLVSENTAPTAAIAANSKPFTQLTGITVNIVTLELSAMVQKVALDLGGGQSQYHVIYADPYQVLAPYQRGLVNLTELAEEPGLPPLPGGFGDFIETQLDAAGRFVDPQSVYALPYDCPTMVWQYRQDLFEKHRTAMSDDLGFDPMPSESTTWQQYLEIATWFNDHTDDVPYGTGHQAKQHDSLMCDFSNVLWAYGGDYFDDGDRVGRLGTRDPGACRLDSDEAVEGAEFYARLLQVAHPGSTTWDWDGVGSAFAAGQVAMCPNWHEFAAGNEEALPGKVAYAPLPKGPARRAHMYGGTGIAVNGNCSEHERRAAWLFVLWATSPRTQLSVLTSDAGGGTPTRSSVYARPDVRRAERRPSDMPNMLTADAVKQAWQDDQIGLRPKIPMWNECDTAIYTEVSRMLLGDASPSEAMRSATERFDRIVARGWAA